ncbi:hypothetical protein BDV39DRAFT_46424 [Aspergillus sergii]|uniref:Uncharacterized protein n=1 Tax=Aspergillus sergii TaxID=1034303 RepID=A0A5N6X9Q0_9EURO|nr:hypothetical protein BDV39DRAFT_46424 [Aspergillus sergii]
MIHLLKPCIIIFAVYYFHLTLRKSCIRFLVSSMSTDPRLNRGSRADSFGTDCNCTLSFAYLQAFSLSKRFGKPGCDWVISVPIFCRLLQYPGLHIHHEPILVSNALQLGNEESEENKVERKA